MNGAKCILLTLSILWCNQQYKSASSRQKNTFLIWMKTEWFQNQTSALAENNWKGKHIYVRRFIWICREERFQARQETPWYSDKTPCRDVIWIISIFSFKIQPWHHTEFPNPCSHCWIPHGTWTKWLHQDKSVQDRSSFTFDLFLMLVFSSRRMEEYVPQR